MEVVELTVQTNVGDHYPPICEFCGCKIDYPAKRCAALADGWCQP